MPRSVQAIYEHGVLRPLEPLNLAENEQITLIIEGASHEENGPGLPIASEMELTNEEFDRLLDELASGPPLPRLAADFSRADIYSDHD